MNPVIVGSIEQLLEALRARRDELQITNEVIDDIAGLSDRHASKLLAANFPSRALGKVSFPLILGALGLGIAKIEIVEDPEQVKRVEGRWLKWKRQPCGTPRVRLSPAAIQCATPLVLQASAKHANAARNAMLAPEQRSAIARRAATCRWRKQRQRQS